MRPLPRSFWLLAFLVFSAGAALLFGYRIFEDMAGGNTGTAPRRLAEELVGGYAALALMPGVAVVARRFPIARGRLRRSLPAHLVTLLVYSAPTRCFWRWRTSYCFRSWAFRSIRICPSSASAPGRSWRTTSSGTGSS